MDGDIFELTDLRGSPQFLFGYLVTSAPIDIMSEASEVSTFHELHELKTMKRSNTSMIKHSFLLYFPCELLMNFLNIDRYI